MIDEPRLVIAQRPTRRDRLHGAWWPRTESADRELAPMLALAAQRFGAIHGVMLNQDEWMAPSPTGTYSGWSARNGRTRISWYGMTEPHQVMLRCDHSRQLLLLLIPPATPENVAVTATLMACTSGNELTPTDTLDHAAAGTRTR